MVLSIVMSAYILSIAGSNCPYKSGIIVTTTSIVAWFVEIPTINTCIILAVEYGNARLRLIGCSDTQDNQKINPSSHNPSMG